MATAVLWAAAFLVFVVMWVCVYLWRRDMSRLTIDITDQQHQSLKALAAFQGKTIKQYALERLFPGDADADQAWQELKNLLKTRIDEGLAGKIATKGVDQMLDEELAEGRRD
jgi:mannitol-1-phosphate/altronate dehydrogenase